MSYNINDMCRVCLLPTTSRRYSNLFFSSGRSIQLWAKVMACAWVQVFEGDGLPSQICYKCHNKLDIAYQFKQQCEAADVQIRQILNRTASNKVPPNNIDLTQTHPECLAECKPLNFNITSECLDLVQTDLSLPSYRLMQDIPLSQQIDLKIRDSDFAAMKQEPGFTTNLNLFNTLSLTKGDCQLSSAFKCESFNDSDIMLDSLPAKLFESVNESINQGAVDTVDQIDSKYPVWDLQQKVQAPVANNNDCMLSSTDKISSHKGKDNILDSVHVNEELSFLSDDRSSSPVMEKDKISNDLNSTSDINTVTGNSLDISISQKDFSTDKNSNTEDRVLSPNPIEPTQIIKKRTRKKPDKDKKVNKDTKACTEKNPKKDVQEQCEHCGKVFKYRHYMIQHLRTHTGDKPYECSDCDQKFTLNNSLVSHLRIHSGIKPFICAVCGKGFTQSAGLKSHMRAHTGEQPFECEICGKKFSQRSNLIIHKKIHSGQRDHICEICNIAFKFHKHLRSHMKLHEEKEFKCSVCPKSFHRKTYLQTHLSVHSGERPYKCSVCGYAFSNSSNLRAHSRIHSGIKPYKCKDCKKSFSQSGGLNRHMQQHSYLPMNSIPGKD